MVNASITYSVGMVTWLDGRIIMAANKSIIIDYEYISWEPFTKNSIVREW